MFSGIFARRRSTIMLGDCELASFSKRLIVVFLSVVGDFISHGMLLINMSGFLLRGVSEGLMISIWNPIEDKNEIVAISWDLR